jgi:hypothetical protein
VDGDATDEAFQPSPAPSSSPSPAPSPAYEAVRRAVVRLSRGLDDFEITIEVCCGADWVSPLPLYPPYPTGPHTPTCARTHAAKVLEAELASAGASGVGVLSRSQVEAALGKLDAENLVMYSGGVVYRI